MHSRSAVDLRIADILARITEAENYYKGLEALHFRRADGSVVAVKKTNTAESFCRKFIAKFNEEFRTFYTNSKNLYTTVNTRRSIGDIFRCAYSILGDKITLKDIIVEMIKLVDNEEAGSNYCFQINKRVYKFRGNKNGNFFDPGQHDELGFTEAHYRMLLDS